MGTRIIILGLGLAVGLGFGMFVGERMAPTPEGPDRDHASLESRIAELTRADADKATRIRELEEEIMAAVTARIAAEGKVTELEADLAKAAEAAPAPPADTPEKPAGAVTYADLEKALGKLGQNFQAHMLGDDEELAKEIRDLFARASAEDVAKMIEKYHATAGMGPKTVMAHLLGMSHHPDALKALEDIVRDKDQNMVERRMASHGLAFSGAESLKPLLREMAKEDPDRGTRANSAFGLYRMDDPEAVNLYFKACDDAFTAKDPAATLYLSGLQLMDDRALPGMRERVRTYGDWQAKITLISLLGQKKDQGSLNLLTEISRDESQKEEVRAAAESAIKQIEADK